jgi:NADH:ubiquinone reductase (H+-translocating)
MAIVGRGSAVTDLNWASYSGVLAWLSWLFLHIFMLIGFRNRVVVLLEWAVAYVTLQRNVRLITEAAHTANEPFTAEIAKKSAPV